MEPLNDVTQNVSTEFSSQSTHFEIEAILGSMFFGNTGVTCQNMPGDSSEPNCSSNHLAEGTPYDSGLEVTADGRVLRAGMPVRYQGQDECLNDDGMVE